MYIMNPDLPLHETYPFAPSRVAKALEPQILKETAFSDAQIPEDHPSTLRKTKQNVGGGETTQR